MCVCVCANFLRRPGFLCGCSALCWSIWGIDRMMEVEGGGGGVMHGGFLGGCQRSRSEI